MGKWLEMTVKWAFVIVIRFDSDYSCLMLIAYKVFEMVSRNLFRFLNPGRGALCVEMGFYADISWESRCNIEINV